jgi:hypothetical protein
VSRLHVVGFSTVADFLTDSSGPAAVIPDVIGVPAVVVFLHAVAGFTTFVGIPLVLAFLVLLSFLILLVSVLLLASLMLRGFL